MIAAPARRLLDVAGRDQVAVADVARPARRGRRARGRGRSSGRRSCSRGASGASACSSVPSTGSCLVVDLDRAHRGLGGGLVDRRHGGHRLAGEPHPVDRDDRAILDRVAVVGLDVGRDRRRSGPRRRPRSASAAAESIDADQRVGVRAAQRPCRAASRPSPCRRRTAPGRAASRARPCAAARRRPRAAPMRSRTVIAADLPARGLEDRAVAGAAAEVAVEPVADVLLGARARRRRAGS